MSEENKCGHEHHIPIDEMCLKLQEATGQGGMDVATPIPIMQRKYMERCEMLTSLLKDVDHLLSSIRSYTDVNHHFKDVHSNVKHVLGE